MSSQSFFELLISPMAIALLFLIASLSTGLLSILLPRRRPRIEVVRILNGYCLAGVVMFALGWFVDHLSFGMSEWMASVYLTYFSILMIAIFGAPSVVFLVAIHKGTIALCLLASLGIGILLLLIFFSIGAGLPAYGFAEWVEYAILFSLFSLATMLSFSVGARIPWRPRE